MRKVENNKMSHFTLSDNNLISFFNEFCADVEKYSQYIPEIRTLDKEKGLSDILASMSNETRKNFNKLVENENYIYIGTEDKIEYGKIRSNLKLVYGEYKDVDSYINLFRNVLLFITDYIQIEGIERLFSENYFNIEWNLYMEIDFEKNKKQIYRDHFIHQIRDAYFGYKLLSETSMYDKVLNAVRDRKDTTFSKFIVSSSKREALKRYVSNKKLYQQVGIINDEEIGSKDNRIKTYEDNINKIQDIVIEEIILKSWFLAALFHDIGYPIAYYFRLSKQLDKYMPYLRIMDNHNHAEFIELTNILSNSYLFRTEDISEIQELYYKNDHGVLSAISFLLHFYSTGIINGLSDSDKCIVEISAVAIYLHTREYSIQGKESNHARMFFHQNPIAYLLRICDDLQEWERLFFTVDSNKNILICDRCKTAVRIDDDGDTVDHKNANYCCKCNNKFEKITAFNYRKINFIELCKDMLVSFEEDKLTVNINYDLFKQLEVLIVNKDFAKYRLKELNNLDKLFNDQPYFPNIELKYFIDYNPIALKCEILYRYLKSMYAKNSLGKIDLETELSVYKALLEKEIKKIYQVGNMRINKCKEIYTTNIEKITEFYLPLLLLKKVKENEKYNKSVRDLVEDTKWTSKWLSGENYHIKELMNDYLKTNRDRISNIGGDREIICIVKQYVDCKKNSEYQYNLDFFDDLYIFKKMSEIIK